MLSFKSSDWSLVATTIKDLSRGKIIDLGRRFTSPYLLVRVASREQKDTWYFGGKLWATNLVLGKQAKFYQVDLDLFEQELLIVPKYFEGKYSLLYEAPKYFPDVILKVWEYTGEIEETENPANIELITGIQTEIITQLSDKLQELENGLDNLNIQASIPEVQIEQINANTNTSISQTIDSLNTLSSNLGKVLNGSASPDILQTQNSLIEEFI